MPNKLNQILAIARYEMLLQWRRRSLLVIVFSFIAMISFFMLMVGSDDEPILGDLMSTDVATAVLLFSFGPLAILTSMLTFPPTVAEAIPKDRQWGMAELFGAMPITTGTYLFGKLLGVWAIVLLVLAGAGIFQWLAMVFVAGRLKLWPFIELWVLAIAPAGILMSSFAVLLASRQPNRRRATVIGGLITAVAIFMVPVTVGEQASGWLAALNPGVWFTIVMYVVNKYMEIAGVANESLSSYWNANSTFVAQVIIVGILEIAFLYLAVWGWWKRSED